MRYAIVPATLEHCFQMAPRESDTREFAACAGITPREGMIQGLNGSRETLVALADGIPFAMAGINPIPGIDAAAPWMVATDEFKAHSRWFLANAKPIVRGWAMEYRWLLNYVDARNMDAIKFLRWLGFRFHEAVPYGVEGRPFYLFDMEG